MILVTDGQGGKLGAALVSAIRERFPQEELLAVGTNCAATQQMLKSGALQGATGENAAIVASRRASVILGPVGIFAADSMLGEITPAMATAFARANAVKILIPFNRCETLIAGIGNPPLSDLISDALQKLEVVLQGKA